MHDKHGCEIRRGDFIRYDALRWAASRHHFVPVVGVVVGVIASSDTCNVQAARAERHELGGGRFGGDCCVYAAEEPFAVALHHDIVTARETAVVMRADGSGPFGRDGDDELPPAA